MRPLYRSLPRLASELLTQQAGEPASFANSSEACLVKGWRGRASASGGLPATSCSPPDVFIVDVAHALSRGRHGGEGKGRESISD